MSLNVTTGLPIGDAGYVVYTADVTAGITSLVVVSFVSLITIVALLSAIAVSAFNTRRATEEQLFVRTHVAAYFVSLLLCDLLQAIGSIMNIRWLRENGVQVGSFCDAQGVIMQTADIGSAIWIFVIILHTFNIIFTDWKTNKCVLWATLISGWSFIIAMVICGPAITNMKSLQPFYGISGYWCWISPAYPAGRIALGYLFMILAAATSVILSVFIILRLRGNIVPHGWRVQFVFSRNTIDHADTSSTTIAKQMLPFPITYAILIIPITTARFIEWTGHYIAFAGLIFCAVIYLLSGAVNALLFVAIRHILPPQSVTSCKWKISAPRLLQSDTFEFDPEFDPQYDAPAAAEIRSAMHQRDMRTVSITPTMATTIVGAPIAAGVSAFPPTPLFHRSNSYASELSAKHMAPPEGVPTDIEVSGRDSMESLYTNRVWASPMEEIQLGSGKRVPSTVPEEYLSPRWS